MKSLKNEILDFVDNDRESTQQYEEGNSTDKILSFATRENGDVGEEIYSEIDLKSTQNLKKKLEYRFGDKIRTDIETCDEWILLEIILT